MQVASIVASKKDRRNSRIANVPVMQKDALCMTSGDAVSGYMAGTASGTASWNNPTLLVGSGDANRSQWVSQCHQERIPDKRGHPLIPTDLLLPPRNGCTHGAGAATDPADVVPENCIASLLGGGVSSRNQQNVQQNTQQNVSAALQRYLNTQQSAQQSASADVKRRLMTIQLNAQQKTQQNVSTALQPCLTEIGLGSSEGSNPISNPMLFPISSLAALGAAYLDQEKSTKPQQPQSSLQSPLEQLLNKSSSSELVSAAMLLLREARRRKQQQQQSSQVQLEALLEGIFKNKS